jgi:LPS-assembly lipoprotein
MSSSEGLGQQRRALLAAPLLALAGCGFELKRAASLQFQSIALTGFAPRSPLAEELRTALARSVTVVDAPAQAQVVFHALRDERTRRVVTFTASGQVRDIQLRMLLKYRAETPAQRELVPDTEIVQLRELTFAESKTLGKEQEAQQLFLEMQSDIVLQLMLRLSTIRLS